MEANALNIERVYEAVTHRSDLRENRLTNNNSIRKWRGIFTVLLLLITILTTSCTVIGVDYGKLQAYSPNTACKLNCKILEIAAFKNYSFENATTTNALSFNKFGHVNLLTTEYGHARH